MKGLITLLALLPLLASAEVYRWQDADGNWHFGDQPPQEQHETLDIKAPPKIGQGERVREINERALRLRQSEKAQQKEQASEQQKQQNAIARQCREAKARLKRLHGRFVYHDEDGSVSHPTLDQVEIDKQEVRQWIQQNCTS
ncbi:hypothetical protein T9A_00498 [Alcanivorax jadensis T9]|jgi:hypothetical protein|uniref:DUF4124 domain-containing protein n=1 Tax=Alcanivorax jadensis T9 TaxID=1177181 RepID=A0ABR4WF55_9GAMM|nr:DUF4124 domain-containing protein [Alcanivorax jadensis]KGD62207.1 hypothetical protein T9A_00498 [Alcanivorax jadensis T9]MBP22213.1 DUF4124 domain-containing protein [Alcanivorax sp.]|tara:strand:- start:170 stop:595 length:426 start_codon:yes stop_codon:yes gene_type:complete